MAEKEPLILVTNDDGIESEGLEALRFVAEGFGEVWVVAPSFEQSGVGHGITLHRPQKKRNPRLHSVRGLPQCLRRIPPHRGSRLPGALHGADRCRTDARA